MNLGAKARRSRGGWQTALLVVAVLVLVEVAVGAVETRLSVDNQHIEEIGSIVADLEAVGQEEGATTVLFFGNSLTRRGVDLPKFEEALAANGAPNVETAAVYPDDTSVLDWLYLYESTIASGEAVPDTVVIGFGIWHLEDRAISRAQSYRLGRHFVSWSALRELFANDVTSLPDRANVLLSKLSATFANRERIAQRVLSFLPYYQESARAINDMNLASNAVNAVATEKTYDRLARLITTIEDSGADLVLMAMPIQVEWPLDPRIAEVAGDNGATYIDARDVAGLTLDMFEDDLHLNPATGTPLYTDHAATLLAPLLATTGDVR